MTGDCLHYQRTGFEIKFQHSFSKYLMNYYIPSGILVVFSWVSEKIEDKTIYQIKVIFLFQIGFVIPIEMIPGRMSLLMILFLNLQTIQVSISSRSPESVSTTHINDWMIACILFVIFAIIEYGAALFCRFLFDYKSLPKDYGRKQLMQVDLMCLITSIVSFSIFNIVFFALTIYRINHSYF